jgi:hypothetical protein
MRTQAREGIGPAIRKPVGRPLALEGVCLSRTSVLVRERVGAKLEM